VTALHRLFLVDDEPLALQRLARLIAATGRAEVVGEATDPVDALARISAATVDAVLLDISMPGLDGLALARQLPAGIAVVFTTAHDHHALHAFEVDVLDYLVKPVRAEHLARALAKLDRRRVQPAAQPERLASRLGDRVHFVELARVTHFVSEAKLTYAVTDDRSYIVDDTIVDLERRYAAAGFVRVHRGALVRVAAIAELQAGVDGTRVRLGDGKTELAVARDRVRAVKDRLGLP
jgi:two-component system, LytTR family, response regulator